MKVKDIINSLSLFNPDAELSVNISGMNINIEGIYSWAAYPEESYQMPRDIDKEKSLTPEVILKTHLSCSEESLISQGDIANEIREIIADHLCLNTNEVLDRAYFSTDLKADALDMFELSCLIEQHFDIELDNDMIEFIDRGRVIDIITLVSQIINDKY